MSYDIFVSYSSKDKIVADAVVAALEKKNLRCWYAPRDIQPGTDWGESITHAINDSALMLLIFSKNSNQSKRVLDEIYYAVSEEKTILPFRIENLDPSGAMRLHLLSRHWLDAYDPSWEAHINKLVNTAAKNLGVEPVPSNEEIQIPIPTTIEPVSKGLPWKLIGIILAIVIVIASVIGFMQVGGRDSVDETPTLAVAESLSTATQESTATEESSATIEPGAVPIIADKETPTEPPPTEIPIEVMLNGYFTANEISLDPQKWQNMESYTFIENLFVNLTNYDMAKSEIIPEAAESWTISPDARFYTFKIRADIPWVIHTLEGDTVQILEDGEPRFVNAHDFVYAFKRLCDPKTEMGGIDHIIAPTIKGCEDVLNYEDRDNIPQEMLDNIGVQAISDDELLIELENPSAYFLAMTGMHALAALPSWALEEYGGAWTNPGIMPTNAYYVIDQWNTGNSVRLKRNSLLPEDMSGSGNIDAIKFVILRDIDEAYELWLNNEIDYCRVPTEKILSHRVSFSRETSQLFEQVVWYFGFDTRREPFDNVHVRRAFATAFDNAAFVNENLQGQGIPMKHLGPAGVFGAPPVDEIGVGYDPEFAQAEMAAAGYPDCQGFAEVRLGLMESQYQYFTENIVRKWEENLNCPEGTIILPTSAASELFEDYIPDIFYGAWAGDYPDENDWVGEVLSCDRLIFMAVERTCNEIDDLIAQASIETKNSTRIDLYYQIEEAFFGTEGEFPIAPVFMAANYYGDHTWLERTQALPGREAFYNWTIDMDAKLEALGK
jgi:oligopeptide transport system substrate-binding protein